MSECIGEGCTHSSHAGEKVVVPVKRQKCGAEAVYKYDGEGQAVGVICDRRPNHNGTHRGRVEWQGGERETVRWKTQIESRKATQ